MTSKQKRAVIETASRSAHLFTPAHGLPVLIDFADKSNPYSLSEPVSYQNDVVHVRMPERFKWDGCSIPSWVPLLPWLVWEILCRYVLPRMLSGTPLSIACWSTLIAGICYSLRLLPYMQHMGRHARAAAVHDWLYRTQRVARAVADAIMLSIMQSDGVPLDVRMIIYLQLRLLGWTAWRRNARSIDSARKAVKATKI
jgi:hypothetical protein